MGGAGPRPMRCGLYMGRSAQPMRRPTSFHRSARAAAHEMWCTAVPATICAMTESTLPMRWPTRFCGLARAAAHHMLCAVSTTMTTSTSALPMRGNQPTFTDRGTGGPRVTCAKKPQKSGLRCVSQQKTTTTGEENKWI